MYIVGVNSKAELRNVSQKFDSVISPNKMPKMREYTTKAEAASVGVAAPVYIEPKRPTGMTSKGNRAFKARSFCPLEK